MRGGRADGVGVFPVTVRKASVSLDQRKKTHKGMENEGSKMIRAGTDPLQKVTDEAIREEIELWTEKVFGPQRHHVCEHTPGSGM
jgi:hypothetical protein